MVVDDQISMAEFICDAAEDLNFEVQAYDNSKDFKAAYLKSKPWAIFMDIVIPDTDGNELIEWLTQQNSDTPIVIMSGYEGKYLNTAKLLAEARGAIVIDTLAKPFSIEKIEELLTAILASR